MTSLLINLFQDWTISPFIQCWVHLEDLGDLGDLTVDKPVLGLDHVSLHTVLGTS